MTWRKRKDKPESRIASHKEIFTIKKSEQLSESDI